MILLIVDDSPVYLKLLRAQLEGEGHEVVEAGNGAEALQALEHRGVDAVISDILMPVMDGYRLCYEIRKSSTINSGVAIVLYTATYSASSDRQLADTMGADYYLFKPAPPAEILRAVEEAIKKSNHRKSSRAQTDRSNLVDQSAVNLVRKLEARGQHLHELVGAHQSTFVEVLEQNQRLERHVAQLTAALSESHRQIEALTGHADEQKRTLNGNVEKVKRSLDVPGNPTPAGAKEGPGRG